MLLLRYKKTDKLLDQRGTDPYYSVFAKTNNRIPGKLLDQTDTEGYYSIFVHAKTKEVTR